MSEKPATVRKRVMVLVSSRLPIRSRVWGYGYADLADLFRMKEQTVRQWVCGDNGKAVKAKKRPARAKRLDPSDLESLVRLAVELRPDLLWPMHCPTCAELYGSTAPAALSCSNAFHMCRDCTWKNGTLLKQCITCEDADHVDATPGETAN